MSTQICKHCGRMIGDWEDWRYMGGQWVKCKRWMHAHEDGPDAYQECKELDGLEAEPVEQY